MQELINSFTRFSAAITLYGMQEFQQVLGAAMDAPAGINVKKLRESLDSLSNAIMHELDASHKPTYDSVTSMTNEVVGKTIDTMRAPMLDPNHVMQAASDVVKKAADSFTAVVEHDSKSESHKTKKA